MPQKSPSVLLVSMPWTVLSEPSLGLGILSSRLTQDNIPNTVKHFNLQLLKYLKDSTYNALSLSWALNDFLFTANLDEAIDNTQYDHLKILATEILNANLPPDWRAYDTPEKLCDFFLRIRNEIIPQYLHDCCKTVIQSEATMIGLTCMFDQTFASVSLAKMIKEHSPEKLIVLGGYGVNNETGLEIIRAFPWIDVVASGEGESIISKLANASVNKEELHAIANINYRMQKGAMVYTTPRSAPISAMPDNNAPDYTDYFNDIETLRQNEQVAIAPSSLPIESSRGCWWGEKHHCIFCGIDESTMKYRYLSSEKVINTLTRLRNKHAMNAFRLVDYILPLNYYHTLLPALGHIEPTFELSCEIKANLNRSIFELLAKAGFKAVQPGIESFSSSVLKSMNKGVSGIQNILTLKLGREYGVNIHYNILFALPTDRAQEYEEQARIIPLLYHLDPPFNFANTSITRHSPMHTAPETYHLQPPLQHEPRYKLILSSEALQKYGFNLDNYCYYFEKKTVANHELANFYYLLRQQIRHWKQIQRSNAVKLEVLYTEEGVEFYDSRYSESGHTYREGSLTKSVYRLCDETIVTVQKIYDALGKQWDQTAVDAAISDLDEKRIIYREAEKIVGLALPVKQTFADAMPDVRR